MGKLERHQKPERKQISHEYTVEIRNQYVGRGYRSYEDVKVPNFKIEQIIGEKRKRVVMGNASDHVLDY